MVVSYTLHPHLWGYPSSVYLNFPCRVIGIEHVCTRHDEGLATYEFQVENPGHVNQGVQQVSLNGQALSDKVIPLSPDNGSYTVLIVMG